MAILSFETSMDGDLFVAAGTCITKLRGSREKFDTDKVRIDVPVCEGAAKIEFGSRYGMRIPGGASVNRFRMSIDTREAFGWDIQNKLYISYDDRGRNRISYSAFDRRTGKNNNSRVIVRNGIAMYIRQNKNNSAVLTVRDANLYDSDEGQARIRRAVKKAKKLRGSNIIYMYEKNCAKYEESASVLYEKLIDMGYDNVYFVTDLALPAVQDLPEKYRKHLIQKDSDRHLEYFFAAETLISTETPDHALQLRVASKPAADKITKEPLNYIFLQHGPTYMVSLNKENRSGFLKKPWMKLHRTVVSSELEAQHFTELGGMDREDLYITGMAKFDRAFRNRGADRIVIMPTWRRWELNQARDDLAGTNYFGMIRTMYEAVPEELKEKIVILPHPLMADRFRSIAESGAGNDAEMCSRILVTESYENVLRDCGMLITDYSSISYDAYYRGANVIFYWAEKDACMTHYGEGTRLMLNTENVFGPVAMDGDELAAAVRERYGKAQREQDLERYRKIIAFHDNRNTERIVEHLIKDGILDSR